MRGDAPIKVVADAINVSVLTMQLYEEGMRIPRDETMRRIADYFGVSAEDFFLKTNRTIRAVKGARI
ncbi:MAG: helix-turn-helix transcriptional regulator [Oscillospiraceae bacterium]|nr:helix-turn-helix transcriptional regulator [Oscillospiraceae bacterium]